MKKKYIESQETINDLSKYFDHKNSYYPGYPDIEGFYPNNLIVLAYVKKSKSGVELDCNFWNRTFIYNYGITNFNAILKNLYKKGALDIIDNHYIINKYGEQVLTRNSYIEDMDSRFKETGHFGISNRNNRMDIYRMSACLQGKDDIFHLDSEATYKDYLTEFVNPDHIEELTWEQLLDADIRYKFYTLHTINEYKEFGIKEIKIQAGIEKHWY